MPEHLTDALRLTNDDDGTDYELQEGFTSAWVKVGNIAVWIRNTGDGVAVGLYPNGKEADSELESAYASFEASERMGGEE